MIEGSHSSDHTAFSKSFIVVRERHSMSGSPCLTSENIEDSPSAMKKTRKRELNKTKIPQKLIENRRQEIIASLDKIKEEDEVVIQSIPRVYTGSKRGSNFRGVSVNGKKWQVMVMGFGKKRYYGGIKDENEAAKLYDKYAILTQGVGAKTNFSYTKKQMLDILSENLTFE
uniref:AP2/ERF domain-containing protein n=1 Tax=Euplotes harpa TaxID=151035 RepID=A0A7S3J5K1_9SPIT|mmetsp:Transcript_21273/g.24466  ORF Transcript_21273/g.24466 Transcript_21273/m.24466 type:complete len:171 (+) Transcript_21273:211-723(+)